MKFITVLTLLLFISHFSYGQNANNVENKVVLKATSSDTLIVKDSIDTPVAATNAPVNEMISYAKRYLGTPYRYSGNTPLGFDCSGFINYVMGHFGFNLPRSSYGIAELGQTIKLADVQPGDLLFFKGRNINSTTVGHVAMVVEVGPNEIKMIHASTSRGVIIENFKASQYYVPRFLKAKRLNR